MDEYHISNLPERFLMTQHYQSSMEQPNLQNVQAKLHVARQKNHELALQYFRSKYGSAAAYEDFTRKHNMGQIVEQLSPEQILVKHLEMKAKEIEKKAYNQQQFEQQEKYAVNIRQPQWVKKQVKKAGNNPWIKQDKTPQGHKRNETQSSKYVDSAHAPKNKQSQFVSQFKSYLLNKQQIKQQKKEEQLGEHNLNKTSESKMFTTSKLQNKSVVEPVEKKKCYEEELAKKIFKDIIGHCKDESKVQKLALVEYMVKNKKILKVLGITQQSLSSQIMKEYPTKSESEINLQELTYFILKNVGKQKQINELKQEKRTKDVPQGSMLSKQMIIHFQKVFKQLDIHTDLIIKRLPYIDRLANDPLIKNQLNIPAVFEPQINRAVTLRRIFQRIEMECLFGTEEQQKVKQYISWNQFLDYFKSGYSPQSLYNMVNLVDSLHKSDLMGLVEVPDVAIDIIVQTIPKLQIRSGYFNTLSLIQIITKNPEYEHQKYTQVRTESRIAGLPSETFQEVLLRIKQNGQKFMTLKQFLQFFSVKGRPLQQFEQTKNNSTRKNFSGVKVKFADNQLKPQQQNIDGYDSDPQIYQSKIMNKNSPRKSGRSAKRLEQTNSFIQQVKSKPLIRHQYKVTVPVPFSFQERERQISKQKNQKRLKQKMDQQHFKQFRAKPIPEKVLEEGLYEKMIQEQKIKIQERRKSCMIMTLANQKPFSFLNRKTNKKSKQQREQFVFKAKPIPWYCSVDLLQKKKQAEIVRNEKIAKQAQQNLAKAKLPPRMERDFQQKQAKMAMTEQQRLKRPESQPKMYREPPNFDKLHRQFEQGLERRRKQNKKTVPQQFNFNHKNSKVAPASQSQEQFYRQQKKQKLDYKKIMQTKPAAPSTAKFEQLVELRRQQMDKKRKQEQEKRIQDEKWKKIDENLKIKLMAATKNKENKQEKQRQERQAEMRDQMKSFQEWKKKCIQNGRKQPMLIQRPLKRDQKIQKMKKLHQISHTLKGNGIKGKDHDSYFKREELLMLQDYEVLKATMKQFAS